MPLKVIISGATGLIGKRIISKLIERGDSVSVITRNAQKAVKRIKAGVDFIEWNYKGMPMGLAEKLKEADAVIHLAGENIFSGRWNEEHKNKIYSSRVTSTIMLAESIMHSRPKPSVFVCASAVGYYGVKSDIPADENTLHGNDFLANVTKDWENASLPLEKAGVRCVKIRTGIVLDKKEGALAKMLTPFKFFIGGPLGTGKQFFPWVHIDDIVGLYLYALDNKSMHGSYNAVAPVSITMKEFAASLGRVMKRPSFFHVPAFALKFLYGEGAGYLLSDVNVIPVRTNESGYEYKFTNVEDALKDILKK